MSRSLFLPRKDIGANKILEFFKNVLVPFGLDVVGDKIVEKYKNRPDFPPIQLGVYLLKKYGPNAIKKIVDDVYDSINPAIYYEVPAGERVTIDPIQIKQEDLVPLFAMQTSAPDTPAPTFPQATAEEWRQMGWEHFTSNRYEEALAAFEQAILLDPQFPPAYKSKGDCLHRLQRYEEAILAYDHAIRLNPTFALAYHNKGIALDHLGRHREASKAFQKARELGK